MVQIVAVSMPQIMRAAWFCRFFGAPVSVTGAGGAGVAGSSLPGDSAPVDYANSSQWLLT